MIDLLSLGLSHALLALAAWRMVRRPDLDTDNPSATRNKGWGRKPVTPAADA